MDIPHVEALDTASDYAGLLRQRRELDARLAALRSAAIEQFKQRVLAEAQELDVDLLALLAPKRKPRGRREANEVRYCDPDNPGNVWNGRGHPPRWLRERIDAGSHKDAFEVPETG